MNKLALPFILLSLTFAHASDGLLTLYQGVYEPYRLTVLSSAGRLTTGKQHLSVVFESNMVQPANIHLALRLEHPKETLTVRLKPTASPLVYTTEVNLNYAGWWQARVNSPSFGEEISFSFRLFNPVSVTVLITSLASLLLGLISVKVYKPQLLNATNLGGTIVHGLQQAFSISK